MCVAEPRGICTLLGTAELLWGICRMRELEDGGFENGMQDAELGFTAFV
jgi:hypothetical protein